MTHPHRALSSWLLTSLEAVIVELIVISTNSAIEHTQHGHARASLKPPGLGNSMEIIKPRQTFHPLTMYHMATFYEHRFDTT